MYCCRPELVSVPEGVWLCPACQHRHLLETAQAFSDVSCDLICITCHVLGDSAWPCFHIQTLHAAAQKLVQREKMLKRLRKSAGIDSSNIVAGLCPSLYTRSVSNFVTDLPLLILAGIAIIYVEAELSSRGRRARKAVDYSDYVDGADLDY